MQVTGKLVSIHNGFIGDNDIHRKSKGTKDLVKSFRWHLISCEAFVSLELVQKQ
jgi:hypothetical protein